MHPSALLTQLLNPPGPRLLSTADWAALLPALRLHLLTPFVYARLRRTAVWPQLPPAVQAALADDFQEHSLRTVRLQTELEAIAAALRGAGVPVALLKGAALGRLVYDSPAERPMGDIDLLIPADKLGAARRALAQRGYQAQGLYWLAERQQRFRAELPFVCRAPERHGLLVELHWSLVELPYYIAHLPIDELWRTAAPLPELPGAWLPDPAALLLHACAHWALHHSGDESLLWLLDIDRLLRCRGLDWDVLLERAARWQLSAAVRPLIERSVAELGSPAPPAALAALRALPPAPEEAQMRGLGDHRPGRAWRRLRATWQVFDGRQRAAYAGWLALRALLWLPEAWQRSRPPQMAAARATVVEPI